MREVSTGQGTSLLLVTHDIYSALNLCDRFIWIDRGKVRFNGDGKAAIALYESSIKEQEEERLRKRNVAGLAADETRALQVLVRSQTGFALQAPLALDMIELAFDDGGHTALATSHGADGWNLLPESSLGPPEAIDGRVARVFRPTGSIYHKVEWTVVPPTAGRLRAARVRWRYTGSDVAEFCVFTPDRKVLVMGELPGGTGWQETELSERVVAEDLALQKQIDYGTGRVRITGVEFHDAAGRGIVQIVHGDPLTVRVRASITPALADRTVTFVAVFWRQGSSCLAVAHRASLRLPDTDACVIDVKLDPVRLGSGLWYVNVGIGEPGMYEQPVMTYFATDSAWHHLLAGRFELRIVSVSHVDAIHFMVHDATIECHAAGAPVGVRT
jgi:hypothetical protein